VKVYVSKNGTTWVEKYDTPIGGATLTDKTLVVEDDNIGTVTANGTTLTDSGAAWTTSEFVGTYGVARNVTTGEVGYVTANTGTTVTCYTDPITWTIGDTYNIIPPPTTDTLSLVDMITTSNLRW